MTFIAKIGWALLLATVFFSLITLGWAEEEAISEEGFAPTSFEEGYAQIMAYRDAGLKKKIRASELYPQCVAMIDVLWAQDLELAQYEKLLSLKVFYLQQNPHWQAREQLEAFLNEISQSDNQQLAMQATSIKITSKLRLIRSLPRAERDAAVEEIREEILQSEPTKQTALMAGQLIYFFPVIGTDQAAFREQVVQLADHFKDTQDNEVKKAAAQLFGLARFFNLLGNPIELTGTKLDGTDLNFATAYQGKVVLVDFWATWCGPCIREFPQFKKLYATYHPHGFEIIGISLDDTKEPVEKFVAEQEIPWTIVWTEKEAGVRGWDDANAVRYGVNGIPTVILVDENGIVQSIHAKGKKLEQLLAATFPNVPVPAEDETEPNNRK